MAGVNGIEIKVGQVWRTGGGALATVEAIDDHPDFPVNIKVEGDSGRARCGRNGHCWGDINAEDTSDDDDDLIELIHDENGNAQTDSAALAEETLSALGWTFDGQTWVEQPKIDMAAPAPMMEEPGYELLAYVLERAYNQAALGKGKERHANGEPFDEQVMQDGARRFGVGALLFQAFKKSEESQRLPLDRGVNELLGAIVYLAGAVIRREADAQEGGV